MAQRTCTIDGCERTNYAARGWCWLHYRRWRRHGDPLVAVARRQAPIRERMERHLKRADSGCWEWTGYRTTSGYGRVQVDGRSGYSHRVMYETTVGPIPDGLQLDHLCRNPPCCNPDHLEPVTPRENTRRGSGHGKETHCPQGHPYEGDNLKLYRGRRYCRTCQLAHTRASNARRRVAA